jgi:hypothetical protein
MEKQIKKDNKMIEKTFNQLKEEGREINDICFEIFDNFDGLRNISKAYYINDIFYVKWNGNSEFYDYNEKYFLSDLMYYEGFTKEQSLKIIEKMKG